jgi:hypothetical protein
MKKLFILVVVLTAFHFAPSISLAQPSTTAACAKVKFHGLSRYKGEGWARVFRDREVARVLKPLLGKDYRLLIESMKEVSYPEDSLSLVDSKGVLTLRGFVSGLFTIMEAMLIVEPCGKIYVAILDEGKQFLYFSNDKEYVDRLPDAIEQWRNKIEEVRSQPEKKAPLPVMFKSK